MACRQSSFGTRCHLQDLNKAIPSTSEVADMNRKLAVSLMAVCLMFAAATAALNNDRMSRSQVTTQAAVPLP